MNYKVTYFLLHSIDKLISVGANLLARLLG